MDKLRLLMEYGIDIDRRTIILGRHISQINQMSEDQYDDDTTFIQADIILKAFHLFEESPQEKVTIIMSNSGGDFYSGLTICNTLLTTTCPTEIRIMGSACSMGVSIMCCCDKIIAAPETRIMIHEGDPGKNNSKAKSALSEKKLEKELNKRDNNRYLKKIRRKKPEISFEALEKILKHDTYMTAQEALNWGLVDSIMEIKDEFKSIHEKI